jgi:hypothetical protein
MIPVPAMLMGRLACFRIDGHSADRVADNGRNASVVMVAMCGHRNIPLTLLNPEHDSGSSLELTGICTFHELEGQ